MYDLILLGIFLVIVATFLYRRKHNIKKEGLLLLYKTKWGIKLIHKVGGKHPKTFKFLSYISVWLGYILTVSALWLVYTIVKIYVLHPEVVEQIKVPPITPLIPYIDKVVPFLPPFYFTYWIVILAIIAISHEFAHGIFAAYNKVKIKKTGFGFFPFFLPIFLAAFVELNEKQMAKKSNFGQRAVLSAGTFANTITAALFFIVIWIFFIASFTPAGVVFNDYSYSVVGISSITMINGIQVNNPSFEKLSETAKDTDYNEIESGGVKYLGIKGFSGDETKIALYNDAPAINSKLNGAILEINGAKTHSLEKLSEELARYKPGDEIEIKTKTKNSTETYSLVLEENPETSKAWLGIVINKNEAKGFSGRLFSVLSSFKDSSTYYDSRLGEFGIFVYNLLWWLIIISISVAIINMLPMGIFDGGRFFYLTVLAVTGKETWAKNSFKWATYLFLFLLLLIMAIWAWGFLT